MNALTEASHLTEQARESIVQQSLKDTDLTRGLKASMAGDATKTLLSTSMHEGMKHISFKSNSGSARNAYLQQQRQAIAAARTAALRNVADLAEALG